MDKFLLSPFFYLFLSIEIVLSEEATVTTTTRRTSHDTTTRLTTFHSTIVSRTTDTTVNTVTSTTEEPLPNDRFYVKDATGNVCLVMKLSAAFNIPYIATNKEMKSATVELGKVEENATFSGTCTDLNVLLQETLNIQWQASLSSAPWSLKLRIAQNFNLTFYVSFIELSYVRDLVIFPNVADSGSVHIIHGIVNDVSHNKTLHLLEASLGSYYDCQTEQKVLMEENASMQIYSVTISAFRQKSTNTSFYGTRQQCSADSTNHSSNVIPIIVGTILAVLIAIIFITYLVGRRRSRTGYQNI